MSATVAKTTQMSQNIIIYLKMAQKRLKMPSKVSKCLKKTVFIAKRQKKINILRNFSLYF